MISIGKTLVSDDVIEEKFVCDYVDKNRTLLKAFPTFKLFKEKFIVTNSLFDDFVSLAIKNKVPVNGNAVSQSKQVLSNQLKAFIARQLFGNDGFYPLLLSDDKTFLKPTFCKLKSIKFPSLINLTYPFTESPTAKSVNTSL